ncbi:hypothetical protein LOK49_LG12G00847 [Camellia lanceoleosa]|uniref:Uncharacterized protein n=1 Tax=Camellia lanceoleosa TaxID=1840588 RepID=A0ACC0FVJ2_9ERIC|nr:hypothetical protein LOK49_LG12G00847 [Camellia lanceoleosa]
MGSTKTTFVAAALLLCLLAGVSVVRAEDPYLFFEWTVTYGTISPLGVPVQAILINGQFPGPKINCTSNNNIVVNVFNKLDEPFLLTWYGIQQRKNSWQDGTLGTMCPIQPGTNYTFKFQVKDQIEATTISQPLAFKGHLAELVAYSGRSLGRPDGIQINGKSGKVGGSNEPIFNMEAGKTYRYRVCNVGMKTSLNFRIQGHSLKLVEMEGSHTVQNVYDSLDVHIGQCFSVLVEANQEPNDYYMVFSSRFTKQPLTSVAVIRYANGKNSPSSELPAPPPETATGIAWSINQFRSFRWNLTASAARPNPQGSYHYGKINITRTIKLVNSRNNVDGKLRYAINGVSHVEPTTPLKLVEYYGIQDKVFKYDIIKDEPEAASESNEKIVLAPNVLNATFRNFVEIILENHEKTIQTWHLDGYSFFAVANEPGGGLQRRGRTTILLMP